MLSSWWFGGALAVAILLATAGVVLLLAARGRAHDERTAAQIGRHIDDALEDHISASSGRVEDLASVIGQDGELRRARFRGLGRTMVADPLDRVVFAEVVPATEREEWERRNGAMTWRRGASGARAPRSRVRYPIVTGVPRPPDHLDLSTDPVARRTLAAAVEARALRVSSRALVTGSGEPSVLLAHPAIDARGRTVGVVLGALHISSLARVASRVAGPAAFRVSEDSYTLISGGSVKGGVRREVAVPGRRREVAVAVPPRGRSERWAAGLVGAVLALAAAAFAGQAARRERYARRMLARHLAARQAAADRFARALEAAPIGMAMLDARGRLERPNPALERMTGRDVRGAQLSSLLRVHDSQDGLALEETPREGVECRLLGESPLWVIAHLTPLPDDDPAAPRLLLQVQDVTERREAAERLAHQAGHDALTGLSNRRRFDSALRAQHTGRRFPDSRGAVLIVDLDGFKPINDRHGHAAGDEALRAVAAAMRQTLRDDDLVGRLGGDEFGVLLRDADRAGAARVAEKLVRTIEAVARTPVGAGVSASVGVALLAEHDDPAGAADAAMYSAKEAGGGRWEVAAPEPARTEAWSLPGSSADPLAS